MQFKLCWPSLNDLRKTGIKCWEAVSLVHSPKPLCDSGWTKLLWYFLRARLIILFLPSVLLVFLSISLTFIASNKTPATAGVVSGCCLLPVESVVAINTTSCNPAH